MIPSADGAAERIAQALLLLFIFSIPFMRPWLRLLGAYAIVSDFLYLALAAVFALLVLSRRLRLVSDPAYWFIGAYLGAMIVSAVAAGLPSSTIVKLLTQIYLLSLPIIICNLIRDEATLCKAIWWWLAATAAVAAVGVASLGAWFLDPNHWLVDYARFHSGSLPAGDYPRLSSTIPNANLACNYLTVSLLLLLAFRRMRAINPVPFLLFLAAIILTAMATVSPGLGGLVLAIAIWVWLLLRERRRAAARLILAGGTAAALLFVGAMAFTPFLHPTAPFVIDLPALDLTLAPSGRLMTWSDAVRTFLADPVFGRGIGSDAVQVRFQPPTGRLQTLSDAHNVFLSVAVQCGILGLGALVALIVHIVRRTLSLELGQGSAGVVRLAVGLGLLNGLVVQGLGGSFEDARHLWVALGLLLASDRIARESATARMANPALPPSAV